MNHFQKSKYIILDVSADFQLVILSTSEKIIDIKTNLIKKNFVSQMVVLISNILKDNNFFLRDLAGIIVGIGPGSYVGSRLAVLTSKFLSLELKIPLFKISSLILLSSGYKENKITPMIYAKNNFFYSLSLENKKIILSENIYEKIFLDNFENHLLLGSQKFNISVSEIFIHMKKVKNIYFLTPNYYIHY
ncbi:MAG: tRNA (adenosine(37)-N6)-threonylcarbamoyltransferase complex dimerization subunit type 1 TsaB [Candidatus Phytoplasma stylosanthis]|uniref:tRNA (adenosine(37)-N6)-threonylcarbamoyltransferase complex dimerization subunit type 1 TsaB n=1 Tax=Candidatus Phytoplasma stylosanthis TaxID=2798314 RepID=UPI00293A659E|nr:tRNA (adenosine(37)-N6)-threonylcarbamoyltransferase complex dimerization subunit type 1 TsaB [Candidatus Phytoplasma stylosanthis]MDV3167772.1 tRNA (adenosine(37)-N6)-threonylcarbamoyltransferase complex dimerization subunit type 1 TsaB [Candidatus Phytoplasma stylosanthis]MDV3170951.1 tRNA (adenosine(37)-N6)-threonylcarbamoyltransferase complex dimerization subunit type 1 TsaB [Candidatus Phytoplasma stylosanthis]MDV3173536.1 tRNA (adenosine(37)-N6)-threonylcarbamoyltransferase complex dime